MCRCTGPSAGLEGLCGQSRQRGARGRDGSLGGEVRLSTPAEVALGQQPPGEGLPLASLLWNPCVALGEEPRGLLHWPWALLGAQSYREPREEDVPCWGHSAALGEAWNVRPASPAGSDLPVLSHCPAFPAACRAQAGTQGAAEPTPHSFPCSAGLAPACLLR